MTTARLRSAEVIVARWNAGGSSLRQAISLARDQATALAAMIDDDEAWDRLVLVARRTGDPWLATDWPEAFDPLVVVIALCQAMDWRCGDCPLGRTQDGKACANPTVPVTQAGAAIVEGARDVARDALQRLQTTLDTLATASDEKLPPG